MKKQRKDLENALHVMLVIISRFIPEKESIKLIENTGSVTEFLELISKRLKQIEESGWDGTDLEEEKLDVLTTISELYSKENRSKYKRISMPSELVFWFSNYLKKCFREKELMWQNYGVFSSSKFAKKINSDKLEAQT